MNEKFEIRLVIACRLVS